LVDTTLNQVEASITAMLFLSNKSEVYFSEIQTLRILRDTKFLCSSNCNGSYFSSV